MTVSRSTRQTASSPRNKTLASCASLCATRGGRRATSLSANAARGAAPSAPSISASTRSARPNGSVATASRSSASRRMGSWKWGNGLGQTCRREIREAGVEAAEKVRGRRHVHRCRVDARLGSGHAAPRAPRVIGIRDDPAARSSGDEFGHELPTEVGRYGRDVSHDRLRVTEYRTIDPLHHIVVATGRDEERIVDEAGAERRDRLDRRGELELRRDAQKRAGVDHVAVRTASTSSR